MNKTIAKVKNGIHGTIVIPGDKSVSHRSLMISALCDGQTVHVKNFLRSADCLSTLEAIRALGVTVKENEDNSLDITGVGLQGLQEPQTIVDAGDSGTLLRLMMGLLAAQPFLTTFTGDAALHKRPMGRVIKPLEMMGAKIVGRKDNTLLPITILPNEKKNFHGITYEMPVASAQVKSAILLAALTAGVEVKIIEPVPSRNHTECMMRAFGINVETNGNEVVFHPADRLQGPEIIEVPGDISSAAFWLVAGSIIPNSSIVLKNVGVNPSRTGILDVLRDMGADIVETNRYESGGEAIADLHVKSAKLHGTTFGKDIMPRLIDEIPIIAVAALFAEGETKITGAEELRVKETDRLHAIAEEFNKLAPAITELEDGLIIKGGLPLKKSEAFSYDDHRIAMALAIAGAAGEGVEISHPECVNISYPEFYDTLSNVQI